MTLFNRAPVYNLNAVMRETGLQADVLRAWERRYGLPAPQRTPGGHRLYSDYDVAVLKWLRARQAEGMSISRAVDLWKELSGQGRDPLQTGVDAPAPASQIDALRAGWLRACQDFDAFKAEEVISQAFGLYPVETVCFEILQQGLSELGRAWYQGEITVQQEHFATALATRRVETLIAVMPAPTRAQTVLIGCPAGEWHTFPALLLSLLLRRRGFNVVYLGANIPLEQIEQTAAAIQPAVVVLAAQQLTTAPALQSAAAAFQGLGLPVAYGGLIFNRLPQLRGRMPGFFLGEDLPAAAERVEQLASAAFSLPILLPVGAIGPETALAFRAHQAQIEKTLAGLQAGADLEGASLGEINAYFAAGLVAALELGDLAYLEPDMAWVTHLLAGRGIPAEKMNIYLSQYQAAIHQEMGKPGAPIVAWIAAYIAKN